MRHRPQLDAHQHRMLEHALDVARNIGRGDEDGSRPYQRLGDVPRPVRRIPYLDRAGLIVDAEAFAGDDKAR